VSWGVAIVGAGLIGRKRAAAMQKFSNCKLIVVVDINPSAAESLCREFGGQAKSNWEEIVLRRDIDIVIVSTVNKFITPIAIAVAGAGKYVLCEKPLGRNSKEAQTILNAAKESHAVVKTGFNHRHHPAIAKAKQLQEQGHIGALTFLRCRYGHGGRPGYEKEWRASRELCGGGELLDQGVHVVDLFRWFAGEFSEAFGYTPTCFWNMEVEDNGFAMFRSGDGVVAMMHTSWTQWKNLFSFEVFGKDGYLVVEGLGGSYGPETLRVGRRRREGGAPEEQTFTFQGPDLSWEHEWQEFLSAIESNERPVGDGWDGYQANRMIEAVYESAKTGRVVKL
jgi:predicted dehydrogenase